MGVCEHCTYKKPENVKKYFLILKMDAINAIQIMTL